MLVSDLIAYSLRMAGVLGVGQVALPQDTSDALTTLYNMMNQWERKRWLHYRLYEVSCAVTPGQPSYTIGAYTGTGTPDITAVRPGSVESAYIRQLIGSAGYSSLPVDFPLKRIDSREEWSRIALKNLHSWPSSFFYDPTVPNGTVYVWPIPMQSFFELHLTVPGNLSEALTMDAEIENYLPAEIEEAMVFNLAELLLMLYMLPPRPDISGKAADTLATLRATNFRIEKLGMPRAVLGRGGRWKNPNAGFIETAAGVPYSVTGS